MDDEAFPSAMSSMDISASQMPRTLRVRNRRKRYLESHPDYFGSSLESADPLLYDRLIRRFQTSAERESEVREKGYAGTLEADLLRSEAKLSEAQTQSSTSSATYTRTTRGEIISIAPEDEAITRAEATERWQEIMTERFLKGNDTDFDYKSVDENESYDDRKAEERDHEDEWFNDEKPDSSPREGEGEKKALEGETGIQDF